MVIVNTRKSKMTTESVLLNHSCIGNLKDGTTGEACIEHSYATLCNWDGMICWNLHLYYVICLVGCSVCFICYIVVLLINPRCACTRVTLVFSRWTDTQMADWNVAHDLIVIYGEISVQMWTIPVLLINVSSPFSLFML